MVPTLLLLPSLPGILLDGLLHVSPLLPLTFFFFFVLIFYILGYFQELNLSTLNF